MAYKDPNYKKKYYQRNKEREKKRQQENYQENKEKYKKYMKQYYQTHKEQYLEYNRKRNQSPQHKLSSNISRVIRRSLKTGKYNKHWESYVNFSLKNLTHHLEKQFTSKMNWDNYGSYWWIDHITPISAFNFDSYNHIDFKRCFALSNLRPLEKSKNQSKGNKINGNFQSNFKL